MVGLNVSMVMMNSVYERRKEIRTLSMVGLNPTHIGLIFVAEAIILGMVGGSLGYLAGLGFYRVMVLFGQELMVREKLGGIVLKKLNCSGEIMVIIGSSISL